MNSTTTREARKLSLALERLEELAPGFQRIGISATISNLDAASAFLCGNRSCEIVKSGSVKNLSIMIDAPSRATKNLAGSMERFELDEHALSRLERISDLVSKSVSSLIFANTRQIVESLGSRLVYLNSVHDFGGIGVHHSSLDKEERIAIENRFKEGRIKCIIATSSLELGIDIGSINLVIQYGSPRQALRLAQRVGRSGHTHKGIPSGVVIATNPIETLEALAITRLVKSGSFERFEPQAGALDVLANQICGIALDKNRIELDALHGILKRSFAYRNTDIKTLVNLLEFMVKLRLIGFDGKSVTGGGKTRMYYYGHLSVIPDSKRFLVKSVAENRIISTLDEKFVANNVDENSVFITKGLPWKVLSIDKNVISVEPSTDLEAAVPDWTGEDIPVSRETVLGAFGILEEKAVAESATLTKDALNSIKNFKSKQLQCFVPSASSLVVERLEDYCILYTGLGTQANEALSRLLAHFISQRLGRAVNAKSTPYMILLEVRKDVDIVKLLEGLDAKSLVPALRDAIVETELFRYRFITVAKLFGVIDRDAAVSRSFARRIIRVMKNSPIYEETLRELMTNYFDLDILADFVDRIFKKEIKIRSIEPDSPSPLTSTILNAAYYTKELIMPLTPNNELVESFSRFILSKSIKLLCTYCGFHFSRRLGEIKDSDRIACPSCSSPMITLYDDKYLKIIEKRNASKRLTSSDRAVAREMLQYTSLIESYGPKAAIALSVYGIGPRSAARALMMLRRDERLFFIDLIEAQKNFVRTKKYWSL